MNRTFIRSSRKNPCPACGCTDGCRLNGDGTVFCRRVLDRGEVPAGWRFISQLAGSPGGCALAPEGSERPERVEKIGSVALASPDRPTERLPIRTMPVNERDRYIRELAVASGLSDADRSRLRARGMSDLQIERGMYFSLRRRQKAELPSDFPGYYALERELIVAADSIACPVFNPIGRAIGLQYRLHEPIDGKRYAWLSSRVNPVNLPEGELPISYIVPARIARDRVALVEGVGFKPGIAADLTGSVVIGASGGGHAYSPRQFRGYMKYAGDRGLDHRHATIYPDGGDILNRHVLHRLRHTIAFLEDEGIVPAIAWWGQMTKDDPDIDEIAPGTEIRYLDPRRFLARAEERLAETRPAVSPAGPRCR